MLRSLTPTRPDGGNVDDVALALREHDGAEAFGEAGYTLVLLDLLACVGSA